MNKNAQLGRNLPYPSNITDYAFTVSFNNTRFVQTQFPSHIRLPHPKPSTVSLIFFHSLSKRTYLVIVCIECRFSHFSTSITCTHRSKKIIQNLHRYLTTINFEKYKHIHTEKDTLQFFFIFSLLFVCSHLYNVIIISLDGRTNSTKCRNIYPFSSFLTAVDIVVIRS